MSESPTKIEFDPDSLTFAELIELEDSTGRSGLAVIIDWLEGRATVRELSYIALLALRRGDPDLTYEQVLAMEAPSLLDSVEVPVVGGEGQDPPEPAEQNG